MRVFVVAVRVWSEGYRIFYHFQSTSVSTCYSWSVTRTRIWSEWKLDLRTLIIFSNPARGCGWMISVLKWTDGISILILQLSYNSQLGQKIEEEINPFILALKVFAFEIIIRNMDLVLCLVINF
jgi:hypothetical protein